MKKIIWLILLAWGWSLYIGLWDKSLQHKDLISSSADFGYTCAIAGMDRAAMHRELEKSNNGR